MPISNFVKPVPDYYEDTAWPGDPAFYPNPWIPQESSDTSLAPPETSVIPENPIDEKDPYQSKRRAAMEPEWSLSIETLISMQPYIKAERIQRFKNCRSNAYFYRNVETGKVKVMSNACRDRACPFCAQARSREIADQITEWLAGCHHPRFLTLSIRSCNAPLATQIDNIYQAFRRYRLLKGMKKYLRSGVWFFQVTWNAERQQWHPHIHCVLVGKWASWEFLREQWRIASKGSHVVDIEEIKNPEKAARYVARYSARPYKMEGLPLEQRKECISAFQSRRLFGTWGPKPEKPRITKEKIDLGQWEPIGSFAYVHFCNHSDRNARLILDSWIKGVPLEAGISCHAWERTEYSGFYERVFEPDSEDFIGVNPGKEVRDGPDRKASKGKRCTVSVELEPCLF